MELISFLDYRKNTEVYKAKTGNKEAFLSLAEENKLSIYRVARGILKNEEDVKDAAQNTLIKAFENLHTLKKEKYFKTWLIKILINECNEIMRRNKKYVSLDENRDDMYEKHTDSYENIDLTQAINQLSEELRITITLFYFDDLSVKNIADILDISQGTVKSRLSSARAKLRIMLEEEK